MGMVNPVYTARSIRANLFNIEIITECFYSKTSNVSLRVKCLLGNNIYSSTKKDSNCRR